MYNDLDGIHTRLIRVENKLDIHHKLLWTLVFGIWFCIIGICVIIVNAHK